MASRTYGSRGPLVVLLHGGPGAPGYLAPLARMLASTCRVLEPFQRGATDEPLTVARHVADLHAVLAPEAPAVVLGHSWGAMLALAHAAAHPETPRALVLVGCGTFDEKSRAAFRRAHDDRLDANTRRKLEHATLAEAGRLLLPVYSHDLVTSDLELAGCDARAHDETWRDMIRLQEEGVYPAAFAAVTCPVLMLHGEKDPHPGASTREVLRQHIPHLEYRAWDCCGHYPWLERAVACEFVDVVREYAESV